jgi:formiminotetrahydrofolate cyclodeaminase
MASLVHKSLTDLLEAFASSDPTPGGGSASALAAALGASLGMMVAALPKTRSNAPEDREHLRRSHDALHGLRDTLTRLIDEDSAAYDAVVAAYRLPKETDEQKTARKEQIQNALLRATEVPLDVMRASIAALETMQEVARYAHQAAGSDVGVALALLNTGAHGGALNVRINLEGLANRAKAEELAKEASDLERRGAEFVRTGERELQRS